MANLGTTFDANQVSPETGFDPIPAGDYTAFIKESEMKQTKKGDGNYLSLTIEILEGQYKGRNLWDNLNLQNPNQKTVQIAQSTLSQICRATGQMQVTDSQELHNKPMIVTIGFQKGDQSQNQIKKYKKLDGGSTPPPAAPVVNPQVPPANPAGAQAINQSIPPWGQQVNG